MRTIRLVRLIVFYEVQEHELIQYESRSITRSLSSPKEQTFKTERIILWFLNKRNIPILKKDREAFWEKLSPEIHELYNNKYESQLLRLFDFTAWMESKIRKEKLSEVLRARTSAKECYRLRCLIRNSDDKNTLFKSPFSLCNYINSLHITSIFSPLYKENPI